MSNIAIVTDTLSDALEQAHKISLETSIYATRLDDMRYRLEEAYSSAQDQWSLIHSSQNMLSEAGGGEVKLLRKQADKMEEIHDIINEALIDADETNMSLSDFMENLRDRIRELAVGIGAQVQHRPNATTTLSRNLEMDAIAMGATFGAGMIAMNWTSVQQWLQNTAEEVRNKIISVVKEITGYQTPEELMQEMSDRYERILKNTKKKSFNGKCSAFVYQQLKDQGIFGSKDPGCAHGKDYYATWSKKKQTSTGAPVTTYGSDKNSTGLEKLIEASGGKPIKNVAVSFPAVYPYTNAQNSVSGHVMLISEIRDGNVYFMESADGRLWFLDNTPYKEGQPMVLPVDKFLKQYPKMNGVVHFGDPQ